MYLADGDAVSVHTLACAVREIYEKHCANLQLDRLFDYIEAEHPERKAKDLWHVLNGARNFFKHPGESLDEAVELRDADNKHTLFIACHDCAVLCHEDQPAEVQAFNLWFIATEFPHCMEGEQADVANEVISRLDAKFPGLRTAPLAEQKLLGLPSVTGRLWNAVESSATSPPPRLLFGTSTACTICNSPSTIEARNWPKSRRRSRSACQMP
ncbi:hypothetical protein [Ralstonia solanacearum]|uniref:Uncharacterized protein n=1 Tax=Ralstonia solanacearum TaxID=305 RepID=A0AAE3T5W9_RALSL|nr:hypothetical protein [Ralstonia solanacearum]MBB6582225.1 hypothetical protein [Ralstonia solanacearum]MDB0522704.1 hypothetical protein [Ralstonia solanacearum]